YQYHLVESWCPKYIETERRCLPTIVSRQYWENDICTACRERQHLSNRPRAMLIQSPESKMSYTSQLSAQ
ncbi:hypothetical protein BKA56DRAFT_504711, partial [Ilyonectria sp. MPI-CAGE-AT-0026]